MIPILRIKKFIDLIIEFIRTDYVSKHDKRETFLYRVLNGERDEGWDFYKNAVEIFIRDEKDRRRLETRLMFDRTRAELPTIHVREPSKQNGGYDGIGFLTGGVMKVGINKVSDTVRKTFSSRFELMITSGNSLECVTIQEVIESAILASLDTLTVPFFEIVNLTSKELMMESDIERNMLFIKSIDLEIKYEKNEIPKLYTEENINKIKFENPKLLEI